MYWFRNFLIFDYWCKSNHIGIKGTLLTLAQVSLSSFSSGPSRVCTDTEEKLTSNQTKCSSCQVNKAKLLRQGELCSLHVAPPHFEYKKVLSGL